MNDHAHLIRVLTAHAAPGKRDELIRVLEELAGRVREMEGCFGMQICSVREEPEWVAVVSRWESAAAQEKTRPLVEENRARIEGLIQGDPRPYSMTPL